jgi:hypothetical protein
MPSPVAALRCLATIAEQAGADRRVIQRCVDEVFVALAAVDERKFNAIQLAKKVKRADAAYRASNTEGRVVKLAARFNITRQRVHQILSAEDCQTAI